MFVVKVLLRDTHSECKASAKW